VRRAQDAVPTHPGAAKVEAGFWPRGSQ
jgi:hypothetical protein